MELATVKQLKYIGMLLTYKGKSKDVIYDYFKIGSMTELTYDQAVRIIEQLQKYKNIKTPIWER